MTSVLVDLADIWVMADLEADPHEWARAAVSSADVPEERAALLANVLVPALESARREEVPPVMVLFLMPRPGDPAICSVSVRAEGLADEVTLEDLVEEFRLPEEMLELPAQEESIETEAGPATHLVQRYRSPVNPEYEVVQEHEVFVWRVSDPGGDLGVYLSTSHVDLVEAGYWRPVLVELAKSLELAADET
ncbi:hypothetical protein [Kineosporia succinea]|uniref:ESAT-6 protein secretion system EspG family protein n=1 Tax=Kineosporia succinea TaxID=84632 RepID=A0ABT9P5S4_9ACTN|nr:hypothetical protein [Kineosporia succinea]MDP9827911.1 hypothetical protein [Kineosporia succinea]